MGRSYVRTWDTYISQSGADLLNSYHRNNLNPYINFHRPCFFPVVTIDQKGKVKKKYPYEKINTPYEKLKSLLRMETYLRPGITLDKLDAIANQMSDNKFAERMGKDVPNCLNKPIDSLL